MANLWQNLRYTIRVLGKNPGFTVVAVLSLALGIGANTAIFTLINALLLRDLPVRQPERLVQLVAVRPGRFLASTLRIVGVMGKQHIGHLGFGFDSHRPLHLSCFPLIT